MYGGLSNRSRLFMVGVRKLDGELAQRISPLWLPWEPLQLSLMNNWASSQSRMQSLRDRLQQRLESEAA